MSLEKKEAFIDVLVIAMYVDGHLGGKEDKNLHGLLKELGFTEEAERNRFLDVAIGRTRRQMASEETLENYLKKLHKILNSELEKNSLIQAVNDLFVTDGKVATSELKYLDLVKKVFS